MPDLLSMIPFCFLGRAFGERASGDAYMPLEMEHFFEMPRSKPFKWGYLGK
jgi:hypothetical protein